jgi:hypothetical protein
VIGVGIACLSLATAGCGGLKVSAVANIGTTTAVSTPGASSPLAAGGSVAPDTGSNPAGGPAAAFDACLRTHGVPNMPGPSPGQEASVAAGVDPNSPAFQKATQECAKLMPQSAPPALVSHPVGPLLAFAKCMRSHRVPTFPDPDSQGHFDEGAMAGIDRDSSSFQDALKTCRALADNEPLASTGRVSP